MNDDHEIKEKEIIMLHIPFIIIRLIKKNNVDYKRNYSTIASTTKKKRMTITMKSFKTLYIFLI